jgi:hypothetical protein
MFSITTISLMLSVLILLFLCVNVNSKEIKTDQSILGIYLSIYLYILFI